MSGETPEQRAAVEAKIVADNPPEKILEENLAEITRAILNGNDVSHFMLPQPLMERITDSAARWMENRKQPWIAKIDPRADLAFKAQMVREAARQMKGILYEGGKRASASIAEGPTASMEIARLQGELAKVPPFNPSGSAAAEQANGKRRAEIERDLNRWQRRAAGETVPEDAAPEGQPAEGQPAAPAPGSPQAAAQMRQAVAEQMKAEGIKNPHPQINEALKRNPALSSPEDLLAYVKALEAEKEAIAAARTLLVTPAYKFTATEAKQWTDAVVTAHGEPVTDAQKLVLAAARMKRGGTVERGEFNRPTKPEMPSGGIAPFNDHQGQTHTVTGQTDRPAQPGDFILTRQGVRRVVKPTVDGQGVETVGTFVGDTTTTTPVQHGTYAVLETTAAPKAAPSSPAQGSAP